MFCIMYDVETECGSNQPIIKSTKQSACMSIKYANVLIQVPGQGRYTEACSNNNGPGSRKVGAAACPPPLLGTLAICEQQNTEHISNQAFQVLIQPQPSAAQLFFGCLDCRLPAARAGSRLRLLAVVNIKMMCREASHGSSTPHRRQHSHKLFGFDKPILGEHIREQR